MKEEESEEERFTSALVKKLLERFSHFKFGSWFIQVSFFNCMLDKSTDVTYMRKKKVYSDRNRQGNRKREIGKVREKEQVIEAVFIGILG